MAHPHCEKPTGVVRLENRLENRTKGGGRVRSIPAGQIPTPSPRCRLGSAPVCARRPENTLDVLARRRGRGARTRPVLHRLVAKAQSRLGCPSAGFIQRPRLCDHRLRTRRNASATRCRRTSSGASESVRRRMGRRVVPVYRPAGRLAHEQAGPGVFRVRTPRLRPTAGKLVSRVTTGKSIGRLVGRGFAALLEKRLLLQPYPMGETRPLHLPLPLRVDDQLQQATPLGMAIRANTSRGTALAITKMSSDLARLAECGVARCNLARRRARVRTVGPSGHSAVDNRYRLQPRREGAQARLAP